MKLLYVWFNRSESGFIRNTGFNFSPEYEFSVDYSAYNDCYTLSCIHTETCKDIWQRDNIAGLTAIVGENGSGKTTLLNALLSPNVFRKQQFDADISYKEYYAEQDQLQEKICIYDINGKMIIIHNLMPDNFRCLVPKWFHGETEVIEYNVNTMDPEDYSKCIEFINHQTVIYLSNSFYLSNSSGVSISDQRLQSICLTPRSLLSPSSVFFNKITMNRAPVDKHVNFYMLQRAIRTYKQQTNQFDIQSIFQMVLDLQYYTFLLNNFKDNPILSQYIKPLHINICRTSEIFRRDSNMESVYSDTMKWAGVRTKNISKYLNIFSSLVTLLLFEMKYVFGDEVLLTEDTSDLTCAEYLQIAEHMLENHSRIRPANDEQFEYYQHGLEEIKTLYTILVDCSYIQSTLPPEDMAYNEEIILSCTGNEEKYLQFCDCINSFAQYKYSFVLKYLQIESSGMSSGERAMQNMFSWLLLPPSFNKYIEEAPIPTKDDVLLLIDEIDLYMHPEWQRRCLKILAETLKYQYPDKCVQLIIATHSPLVLSDIPKQNTLYLKGISESGTSLQLELADYDETCETFGANIHQILNRSFFLKNTMGSYAYETIHTIAKDLQQLKTLITNNHEIDEIFKKRCESYRSTISLISEPLIRNKLHSLYCDCFPHNQEIDTQVLEQSIDSVPDKAKYMNLDQVSQLKEKLERVAEELGEFLQEKTK